MWRGTLGKTVLLVAAVLVAGGWVVTPGGAPFQNTTTPDFPDPAGLELRTGTAQVYGTGTAKNSKFLPVATWSEGNQPFSVALSALSPPGYGLDPFGGWAPTVRLINGVYVMWFSGFHGVHPGATPNCLFSATSGQASGPFNVQNYYCYPGNIGLFDPSIWISPTGPYLVYNGAPPSADGTNNQVDSQALSADGTRLLTDTPINDLADFSGIPRDVVANTGGRAVVENAALAIEPSPYTDADNHIVTMEMFVSYGTYNGDHSYHTLEIPCAAVTGPCDTNLAVPIDNFLGGSQSGVIQNTGGASVMESAPGVPTSENYLLFAAAPAFADPTNASRSTYAQPTLPSGNFLRQGSSLHVGQYLKNFSTASILEMQGDGNLVLYKYLNPQTRVALWDSRTSGDGNTFAVVQGDANFVIYDNGRPLFATGTDRRPTPVSLALQDDNNLVLSGPSGPYWASGTGGR